MKIEKIVQIDSNDLPDEIYFETSNREGHQIRIQKTSRSLNARLEKIDKNTTRLRLNCLKFEPFKSRSKALAIKAGDKYIAFLQYGKDYRNNRYEIFNIFVEKEHRRLQYGKMLIKKMLNSIDTTNYIVARLISDNMDAYDFFEALGFEIIGFDLYAYSADGLEKQSIELIMGYQGGDDSG